jgi:ribosomal-protein-alanine N-acetyltransferase
MKEAQDEKEKTIRPIGVLDLEQILEIEQASYRTPWTASDFFREITYNQLAYYYLMEAGDRVAGFIGMWLVVDEAHITNVAVSPEFRRQGVAEKLLLFVMELAVQHGARCCILEVRVSNVRALNLYLKHGFRYIGLRKAYYRDNNEDAFLMEARW